MRLEEAWFQVVNKFKLNDILKMKQDITVS